MILLALVPGTHVESLRVIAQKLLTKIDLKFDFQGRQLQIMLSIQTYNYVIQC